MIIHLKDTPVRERQHYLQHAIAPRPICFASTISKQGQVNLSPFSFFNLFSTNPPIIIFSPSRRVRNNTVKHSLENIMELPEVAVNIVDYDMIYQTSLASCEYPKDTNEFIKAGLTPQPSTLIAPPMVLESKIKMECRVIEVKSLGNEGGAGNLVICEVMVMHIDESILDDNKLIDQRKIHHVARLGGDWYCRVDERNLFQVEKPNIKLGIGIDALPETIRNSRILSGNNLGQLANVEYMPAIDPSFYDERMKEIFQYYALNPEELEEELQHYAKTLLDEGKTEAAWQVLLSAISFEL